MINQLKVGLTCAAAIFSLAALPLVSKAASTNLNMEHWTQRVEAFNSFNNSYTSLSDLHGLAANFAVLNSSSAGLMPWQRDAEQTAFLPKLNIGRLAAAQSFSEDQQCLAQAVYYEARSETLAGQKAVAEVVLNRAGSKHFPNNICDVVYEGAERKTGCQFSFSCDGSMDIAPKGKSWERAKLIAQHTLIGAHRPITLSATHYHTVDINPHWAKSVKPTRIIGEHKFYKFKTRRELAMTKSLAP